MEIAFLFLVYDNFSQPKVMKNYLSSNNLYIHPKYPNNVDDYFKKYIINDLVETEWGTYSIVQATLNLLKAAYNNKNNEFFILLSQDIFPIYNFDKLCNKIKKIKHSIFTFYNIYQNFWFTSQWWILKRNDVKIILDNESKNYSKFQIKNYIHAIDELYFLTVLKWNNSNYKFINRKIMYDKFLKYTIQKNPQVFNHILSNELEDIKINKSLFIRKVTSNFTMSEYKTKKKLYVIFIGTETNQDNIIFNDSFDIILITSIKINQIKKEIINRSIYIIFIIYKFYYQTILDIINEKYISNWDIIIFTTENFNLNNYNHIDKIKLALPYDFKNFKLSNKKQFYYIKDNNNNLAFCYSNKN